MIDKSIVKHLIARLSQMKLTDTEQRVLDHIMTTYTTVGIYRSSVCQELTYIESMFDYNSDNSTGIYTAGGTVAPIRELILKRNKVLKSCKRLVSGLTQSEQSRLLLYIESMPQAAGLKNWYSGLLSNLALSEKKHRSKGGLKTSRLGTLLVSNKSQKSVIGSAVQQVNVRLS